MSDPERTTAAASAEAAPASGAPAPKGWLAQLNPLHLFSRDAHRGPLAQALHLVREGQFGQATLLFHKLLETEPDHAEALRGLSGILLRKGGRLNLRSALEHMRRATRATPFDPANYLLTTLLYSRVGVPRQAALERKKMAVTRTLRNNPDNPTANNSMGVILQRLNLHEEAIRCFQKAAAAKPGYDQAHRNLAKTYFVLAQREAGGPRRDELVRLAMQEVRLALAIAKSAVSLITEARLLALGGDSQGARERLAEAAKLEPRHPELREGWRAIGQAGPDSGPEPAPG